MKHDDAARHWTWRLGVLALSAGLASGTVAAQDCTTDTVPTGAGPVCGVLAETEAGRPARAFLGIPYAESTAGARRWTPPLPKSAWRDTLKAVRLGPMCPQPAPPPRGSAPNQPRDEDCLSLNVWTPPDARLGTKLPVMVYIHGGAFVVDGSANPIYDGAHLAASRNVVVVSLNYRLGALGFLAADGLRGNYGFQDQQLALRWVKAQIAHFGGDPARVTIFGESAGALSVGLHLFSAPQSEPLFRAGIMQSNFLGVPYRTLDEAVAGGNIYKRGLGCTDVACLRGKSAEELLDAQNQLPGQLATVFSGAPYFLTFGPVLDGTVLVRQPVEGARRKAAAKPFMIGTTRGEMYVFSDGTPTSPQQYAAQTAGLFGPGFQRVVERYPLAAQGPGALAWYQVQTDYFLGCATRHVASTARAPAYVYFFEHHPSFPVWGLREPCLSAGSSCHGDELPFVFHTASKLGGRFTAQEQKLSEALMDYWTAFAAGTDPNAPHRGGATPTPAWPAFKAGDHATLVIDGTAAIQVRGDPLRETCGFWDGFGYDLTDPWK